MSAPMRLWTLHPKHLDARGLVAVWREGLLAQAVLEGRTRGYRNHPQLIRFRNSTSPVDCIGRYLEAVHAEASRRGYRFDRRRIVSRKRSRRIVATTGQLEFEWRHLAGKLADRDRAWLACIRHVAKPEAHTLFRIVPGPREEWEMGR
jgi:hypothetical protein